MPKKLLMNCLVVVMVVNLIANILKCLLFKSVWIGLTEMAKSNLSKVFNRSEAPTTENNNLIKSSDLNYTAVKYEIKKIYKSLETIEILCK